MTRRTSPAALSDLIPEVIDGLGLAERLDEARVEEAWRSVVGSRIGRHTGRVRFHSGRMVVEVRSAAWRQVLHLERDAWRDRVNESLGAGLVREIVFR